MIWIPLAQYNTLMRLSGDAEVGQTESQISRLLTDPSKSYEEKSRRYGALLSKSLRQKKEIEEKPARVIVENLPELKTELPAKPVVQAEEEPEAVEEQPPVPDITQLLDYVKNKADTFGILPNQQIRNFNGKPIQNSNISKIILYLTQPQYSRVPAGLKRFLVHARQDPVLALLPGVNYQQGAGVIKTVFTRPKPEKWTFF